MGKVLQYSTVSGTFTTCRDIGPAMTDKDAYPRLLLGDIPFRRIDPFLGQLPSPVVQELTALGAGSAGAKNRLGNIYRPLEAAADKDPGPVGLHRINRVELAKMVVIELNAELAWPGPIHPPEDSIQRTRPPYRILPLLRRRRGWNTVW